MFGCIGTLLAFATLVLAICQQRAAREEHCLGARPNWTQSWSCYSLLHGLGELSLSQAPLLKCKMKLIIVPAPQDGLWRVNEIVDVKCLPQGLVSVKCSIYQWNNSICLSWWRPVSKPWLCHQFAMSDVSLGQVCFQPLGLSSPNCKTEVFH